MTAVTSSSVPQLCMPKAILFDWDNTLVDTWPCIIRAMNETITEMNMPTWTPEECRARIGRSMRDTFPELFGDRWLDAKDIYLTAFGRVHIDMLEVLPGAAEMLAGLQERGIYLGVVSNKTGRFLRAESDHLGWNRYFGRLVGAGDAPRDKPAPDPVHMALEGSGVGPGEHVWFVGDNLVDMQCGTDSGCGAILLHPEPPPPEAYGEAYPGCPPRLVFRNCEEFMDYVRTFQFPTPKRDDNERV